MQIKRAELWDLLIETPGTLKDFSEASGVEMRHIYHALLTGYCYRKTLDKLAQALNFKAEDYIIDSKQRNSVPLKKDFLKQEINRRYGSVERCAKALGISDNGLWYILRRGWCTPKSLNRLAAGLGLAEGALLDD